MNEHTRGPRIVKQFDDAQTIVLGPDQGDGRRQLVGTFTGPNRLANATLDAAAPELLEACKGLIQSIRDAPKRSPHQCAAIEIARAAVAKASPP